MNTRLLSPCAVLLAVTTLLAFNAQGEDDEDRLPGWPQHFRLGMLIGFNIRAEFKMNISPTLPNMAGNPGTHGVDRFFDDGYVRVDQTQNAGGYTSYWGYNHPNQYDPLANTLTFHSASSLRITDPGSHSEDAPYTGLDLAYGVDLRQWGRLRSGLEIGFGFLPISIKDSRNLSANVTATPYQFDTSGIVVPQAPFNGGPSGIGPQLPDVATAQSPQTIPAVTSGWRKLEADLFVLRLGPSLYWELHRLWAVSGSAGGVIGLAHGKYSFDELTSYSNGAAVHLSSHFEKDETVYGGYANVTLLFHAEKGADIFLGAQFMSLNDAHFSSADRQAKLKLGGGVFITAGLNWAF